MKYVISLGGSLIKSEKINVEFLKELKKVLAKSKHEFVLICGGGATAREYIEAGRKFGASNVELDLIGMKATELNAALVASILNCRVAKNIDEFKKCKEKIIVGQGYFPGMTTDADSVIIAGLVNAKCVINMSNVKGVYDKDPRTYADAKMYKNMSYDKLIELALKANLGLGTNFIFDLQACKLAKRDKIKLVFIKDIKNLERVIKGKKFIGTIVE